MERDARRMRGDGPFIFTQVKNGIGVEDVVSQVTTAWQRAITAEP
jgi:urease accessory protein